MTSLYKVRLVFFFLPNLIRGSRPTESLIVHQLGHSGVLSTHGTASLFWTQLNGSESGIMSIKHHQLLATGSSHNESRKGKAAMLEIKV